jgi:hypothetical protein
MMAFRIPYIGMDNGSSHRSCTTVAADQANHDSHHMHLNSLLSRHVTIANVTHSQPPRLLFNRLRRTQPSRNGGTTPTPYFACESSATQSTMRPSRPHPRHRRRELGPLSYFRLWPPLLVQDVQAGFPTIAGRNLLPSVVATRLNFAPTRGTGYKYCPHAIGYERAPSTSPLILFY